MEGCKYSNAQCLNDYIAWRKDITQLYGLEYADIYCTEGQFWKHNMTLQKTMQKTICVNEDRKGI